MSRNHKYLPFAAWFLIACSGSSGGGGAPVDSKPDPVEKPDPSGPGAITPADPDPGPGATDPDGGQFQWPLLGSMRGGHYWFDFCEGKSDDTKVPEDPRELVVPGVNQGKAVYYNGFWQTCQKDNHPGTCGGLRARVERGYRLIAADGEVGAGTLFAGDIAAEGDLLTGLFAFPAFAYANTWLAWGMLERPDNFDELAAERWGMALSATNNPYPLAGEDPNDAAHPGGTGQLPMSLTQLRKSDGTWTGNISVTCNVCHSGKVGSADDGPGLGSLYGTNSVGDLTVMFTDIGKVAPMMSSLGLFALNKIRGTGNITNFQFFGVLELTGHVLDAGPAILSIQGEPSTGTEDPPVWWNLGHRVTKFFDGAQVADSKRIELSFHLPNAPIHGLPPGALWEEDKKWIVDHQQDSDAWISSLRSPAWPEGKLGKIDIKLAEAGAILFHNKNLWAAGLNNPTEAPDGGNGSCAGCHGAYSPRFVHDPNFLDSPLLEGVASHIVPLEIIGTDSKRIDGNSPKVIEASKTAWFAYGEGPRDVDGNPLCGNWNDPALRGDRKLGYLAPPLYGVWATAPYFHNGSVPNIHEVLKPSERKTIWRRLSTPSPTDKKLVMGFVTSLDAYDAEKMGWKYESIACGQGVFACDQTKPETIGDTLKTLLNTGLAWNLLNTPLLTDAQIEDRKVYNTTVYSQSNTGHEFTSVLSDAEARAIMEYLKTL